MAFGELRNLLDKYYDGDTSLQEEKEIRRLLKKTGNDSAFEIERQMFGVFEKVREKSAPPEDLNEEIMSSLESKWKGENVSRFGQPLRWIAGIAASFLLALFVWQNTGNQVISPKLVDTYQDEKKAYQATKDVLKLVSKTMKAESGKLSKLSKINENLSHVKKLKKLSKVKNK